MWKCDVASRDTPRSWFFPTSIISNALGNEVPRATKTNKKIKIIIIIIICDRQGFCRCRHHRRAWYTREPNGLLISDNKTPVGLTRLPWQEGKPLAWDVTVICPLAVLYVSGYTPGAAAELAASRKCEKYANMPNSNIFQPTAFENLGTFNSSAVALIFFTWAQEQHRVQWSTWIYLPFQLLANTQQRFYSVLNSARAEKVLCVIRTSNPCCFYL